MTDVAFCIFGQLRDDHQVFPRTAKLAREHGAAVFVSTWRRRGAKAGGIINFSQAGHLFGYELSRVLPASLFTGLNFSRALPGFDAALIGRQPDVETGQILSCFPDAVVDVEGDDLCLDFRDPGVLDSNSIRMLYKAWRCNELKRAAEKRRGRKFDVVIRFRADIVPEISDLEHLIATMRDNEVFIPGATADYANDTLAISSSSASDKLATLFGTAMQSPEHTWANVHVALANHIAEVGLEVRNINFMGIHGSIERQQDNTRLLLTAIETGAFDPDFFAAKDTWRITAMLVGASIAVDHPTSATTALEMLRPLAFADLDLDLLRCTVNLLERCFRATGDVGALCTARIVAIFIDVLLDPAAQDDYLRHRMPVDTLTEALIDVSEDQPFEALLRSRIEDQEQLDPTLRALLGDVRRRAGPERTGSILEGIGVVLDDSFQVQSVRFHKALMRGTDTTSAIAIARGIIERFPHDLRGHDYLGHALEQNRDYRGAQEAARAALRLDPKSPGLMTRLGVLDLRLGDLDEASALFQSARAVWTDDRPWGGLIETEIARGRHGDAATLVEQGLAKFPGSHWLRQLSDRLQTAA